MDISMENLHLVLIFGFNNQTKLSYWASLKLKNQKAIWPQLSDGTRQYLFENLPQEEKEVLVSQIMSAEEIDEMQENVMRNSY